MLPQEEEEEGGGEDGRRGGGGGWAGGREGPVGAGVENVPKQRRPANVCRALPVLYNPYPVEGLCMNQGSDLSCAGSWPSDGWTTGSTQPSSDRRRPLGGGFRVVGRLRLKGLWPE